MQEVGKMKLGRERSSLGDGDGSNAVRDEPAVGKRTLAEQIQPAAQGAGPVQRSAAEAGTSEAPDVRQPGAIDSLFGRPHAVVQRRGSTAGTNDADVHQAAAAGLQGPAQRLPHADRIQQSFGPHDISHIEAHVAGPAAEAATHMGATAYATGNAVAFHSAPDLHTAAHEAAHVVQQRRPLALKGGVGQVGDHHERHADAVADAVVAGRSAAPLLDEVAAAATPAVQRTAGAPVQRYGGGPTGVSDPNAIIPIAAFIGYVEVVEKAYPQDTLTDIVTRIRVQYYSGMAFEQLMIKSHTHDTVTSAWTMPMSIPRKLDKDKIGDDAYKHLGAHADENDKGDNPSPYLQLADGKLVDLGHMLLGLDSLAHPETGDPYRSAGVPGIDPASWVADLGIASVWMSEHERNGSASDDVPANRPSAPNLLQYYKISAPDSDLLGDVDAFGMEDAVKGKTTLSSALRAYYLGQSGTPAAASTRWQTFCRKNGLKYTRSGNSVAWDGSLQATLVPRIDRFNDVFAIRSSILKKAGTTMGGMTVPTGTWPHTPKVLEMFLAWVKPQLEAELASGSAKP
jgi:hypothetical protein